MEEKKKVWIRGAKAGAVRFMAYRTGGRRPLHRAAAQQQPTERSGDGALDGHRTERSDEQETTNNNYDKNDYEN